MMVGFEPTRSKSTDLADQHLNHSVTSSAISTPEACVGISGNPARDNTQEDACKCKMENVISDKKNTVFQNRLHQFIPSTSINGRASGITLFRHSVM